MIVIYYESIRWNSWNHFGCDVNENIVRETGNNIMLEEKKKVEIYTMLCISPNFVHTNMDLFYVF
jgi:hypothetical protein